ncbi:S8 family serine peptidase [Streptomyces sp. YC504]|uniref:S8 family serine peptidase n=1 Tax=Streptomyces mesophilus TaxID=1775132 RepID=A0A6G4XFC4_9ACTN|nr:S8 family serine peptidase [Streptomyces mesophilus]NGO76098.1 S8 family serine peptidase [Streptomyces mesophilus]
MKTRAVHTALAAGLVAVLAVPLTLAGPAGATASAGTAHAGADEKTVTLVTGDRIRILESGGAEPTYSVEPADGGREGVVFERTTLNGSTYIVPSDVADLTGKVLDRELFNVTRLVADGLDDGRRATLPLIVQGEGLDGTRTVRKLDSIDAEAVRLDKDAADELGERLAAGRPEGVRRIWLDAKTRAADLDRNLTQIGADRAWAQGAEGSGATVAVLDTGVDATHKDLAGQIVEAVDFSGSGSTDDKKGHGTHVASTVAGTGALAQGKRKGVAPGAKLLIGKVLGDDGRGDLSWAIAGMEWAAEKGAKVVNMSLGAGPTDGTDATSLALNELSEQYGTLFVVAAGNTGPALGSVSAPGTADKALTVGAVDGTDTVTSFSSRGPRIGDGGLKPEIAGPGLDIVAARAAGIAGGGTDPDYIAMSGTSMATPHVAGIAALVAGEHPDWSGQEIKHLLTGTARPAKGGLFAVGSGTAYAPDALAQSVVPDESNLFVGIEGSTADTARSLGFVNKGSAPVTLHLDVSGDAVSVEPAALTVPAGGRAQARVTVHGAQVPEAGWEGAVTATVTDGPGLTVPVKADRTRWITVKTVDAEGAPLAGQGVVALPLAGGAASSRATGADGTVRLPTKAGRLAVSATLVTGTGTERVRHFVTTDVPDGQAEVTLSSKGSVPLGASLRDRGSREELAVLNLVRRNEKGDNGVILGINAGGAYGQFAKGAFRAVPQRQAAAGTLFLTEHWRLADAGSDNRAGDTKSMYDLAYIREGVPATAEHRLGRWEIGQLARIETDYRALNEERVVQESATPHGTNAYGLSWSSPSFVAAPARQARYVTAEGFAWSRYLHRAKSGVELDLPDPARTYRVGGHYREEWWGGPFGQAASGALTGGKLTAALSDAVDSDGHLGDLRDFTYPSHTVATTVLTRDGAEVYRGGGTKIGATVGPESARYRLVRSRDSGELYGLGGRTTTAWEFTAGGELAELPLLSVSYEAEGTDGANRAPAGRPLTLEVDVDSPATRLIASTAAAYSLDGGATWTRARLSDGEFTIPGHKLEAGSFVALKVAARDAKGNTVEQTVLRALPVK